MTTFPATPQPTAFVSIDFNTVKPLPTRPTPEAIDDMAREYLQAKLMALTASEAAKAKEEELVALVQTWGAVPPRAENSRRLNGRLAELTITKSNTITIKDERVELLKEALEANERGDFFKRLFAQHSKWEMVKGAEAALKEEALPKRLAEKVLNLFGRCIDAKPKKPSLKVVIADPSKPARKPRSRKAAAQ